MLEQQRLRRLIDRLQARAQPPLPAGLVALIIDGTRVGDAQPAVARFIAENSRRFQVERRALMLSRDGRSISTRARSCWPKPPVELRDAGMITGWRDEELSVGNPPVAVIERAACRPLGITTEAVHLNAYVDADTLLVAQARGTQADRSRAFGTTWSAAWCLPANRFSMLSRVKHGKKQGCNSIVFELQRGRWFQCAGR